MDEQKETPDLFPEEREKAIQDAVRVAGRQTVTELADAFNVTKATIRRDLARLEARGTIRRTHGGAVAVELISSESPLTERLLEHHVEKSGIGRRAAELVSDARVVLLDAGTTTLSVARFLRDRRELTVITNDPGIAIELARDGLVEVILLGGTLRKSTMALGGPLAKLTLGQLRADAAVLGMTAISSKDGMFTVNPVEAEVKNEMIKHANQTVIVADGSKLGRLATSFVGPCSAMDHLVTDRTAPSDEVESLRAFGLPVHLVD